MALYAIGDLHLSIDQIRPATRFRRRHYQLYRPMEEFDPVWKNHADRIEKHWNRMIRPEDTVVITGDHSWGESLEKCRKDLDFIKALPGRKILLRGNHDLFWEVNQTGCLNERFKNQLFFLQNNFYAYQDIALVGTKGYCFEKKESWPEFSTIRDQELALLRISFEAAAAAGFSRFIMFLHYPPTSIGERESCFTRLAREYGAKEVVYSHYHGKRRYYDSLHGEVDGINYSLVSADFLKFKPARII